MCLDASAAGSRQLVPPACCEQESRVRQGGKGQVAYLLGSPGGSDAISLEGGFRTQVCKGSSPGLSGATWDTGR